MILLTSITGETIFSLTLNNLFKYKPKFHYNDTT